ncbi:MAG: hypothetical protein JNK53_06325 [Phycisphaerae bacterium]|nr:hypothetical protein [Phycisphaerae bacterium]
MNAGDDGFVSIDAGDLPTLTFARSEFEAGTIRAVLSEAGIRSIAVPCGTGIFGFPMGTRGEGIPIRVLPNDLNRAREVLSEARFVGQSVDWDDVDIGEMPPEIRATLERGGLPRRAGGIMVWVGGVIAVIIGVLMLGGLIMWIAQAARGVRVLAMASGLAASVLLASGCAYTLEGRALEGHGSIEITDSAGGDNLGQPVAGVRIDLIRDPYTMNRTQVATAVSGKDGRFKLTVGAFGAGWMEEEWIVRASRSGYSNIEAPLSLPGSTGGRLMVVSIARGRSGKFQDPVTSDSLLDEARKFDPGAGTMSR